MRVDGDGEFWKHVAVPTVTSAISGAIAASCVGIVGQVLSNTALGAINGANELMPTYTIGFSESVKSIFGWLDDALVYIWE